MASLQDQLLKAGLTDEKKAKKANKEKRQQAKVARKTKVQSIDETKEAAKKTLAEKAEHDRKLNRERENQAQQKAITAQIKQLIQMNKIDRSQGDIGYNFTDGTIKKIYVTKALQDQLSNGRLAIIKLPTEKKTQYEIVPSPVAEKIALRDESYIALINDKTSNHMDEDDPYADYQIPDDLMW